MPPQSVMQATLDGSVGKYSSHMIKAGWEGFDSTWLLFDLEKELLFEHRPRVGEELDLVLSPEMVCVGDYRLEDYAPCPSQTTVGRTSQCRVCAKTLIEFQECIFEPRCHGEECSCGICSEEHAVYLAFYGAFPKVGLTLYPRLKTRLTEQGADAYTLVSIFPDRLAAREAERLISGSFKVPERIHPGRVLALMAQPLDEEAVRDTYLELKSGLKRELKLDAGKLVWLKGYPFETLRSKPRKRETPSRHKGRIVGLKGKYLIYENNGLNALSMNQMPGRFCALY